MKYEVISARELTPDMVHIWKKIQQSFPEYANPYFCPEFTQTVSAVRNDVYVGVLKKGIESVGFFPFHYKRGGYGRPIGLGLSDYHGVIIDPSYDWHPKELMKECKLIRWEFDHLSKSQKQFHNFHKLKAISPIIEVSQGFDKFRSMLDKAGRKQYKEALRKQKKLEGSFGPIKYTKHTCDQSILHQLMTWKSDQCKRTGSVDYFAIDWCRFLIKKIMENRTDDFGGNLSCLHVGDTLASVHFVMYSRSVWHSWFPTYNNELKEYSPGLILLYEIIKSAAKANIEYVDLGKGLSLYKKRVMTGSVELAEGSIKLPSVRNTGFYFREKFERWGRQSSLKPFLKKRGGFVINKLQRKRFE